MYEDDKDLNSSLAKLQDALGSNHTYNAYVSFEIGDLRFSTETKNNNYFMAMSHKRNGSGQANQFTVNLAFAPDISTSDAGIEDANKLEKYLYESGDKVCYLQYGYSYPVRIDSPLYEGTVMKYSVEIRDNMLYYTLSGYSNICMIRDTKIDLEKQEGKRPTEIVKQIFEDHIKPLGYEFRYGNDVTEDTDKTIDYDRVQDMPVMSVIDDLLKLAEYEEDTTETPSIERSIYTFNFEDVKDQKYFVLARIIPGSVNDFDENNTGLVFNWMDRGNSMVIDFRTEFDGSIMLAQSYSDSNSTTVTKGNYNEENEEEIASQGATATSSAVKEDSLNYKATWAQATQYAYKATLITVGIPNHLRLVLTKLKIIPLIYGIQHHTAGVYMVLDIEDQIDSSGFITTISLLKSANESTTRSGGGGVFGGGSSSNRGVGRSDIIGSRSGGGGSSNYGGAGRQ